MRQRRRVQVGEQRLPPDLLVLAPLRLPQLAFSFVRARVVVCQLEHDLAGVLALVVECVPRVHLSSAGDNDFFQVDPHLANHVRLLVVVEDGHFEVVVVGRFVHGEAQFLVPVACQSVIPSRVCVSACRRVWSLNIPFRSLATSLVRLRLLGLLAQSCSAVGVLLSHRLPVGQVLCAVDNDDQGAYLGTVDGHVRVDACCVHAAHCSHVSE